MTFYHKDQLKAFRTLGLIKSVSMRVCFSLLTCHNAHKYQGSRSSESQLRPLWT